MASVTWLAITAPAATRMNLLNRLPTGVWSLRSTAAPIRVDPRVMQHPRCGAGLVTDRRPWVMSPGGGSGGRRAAILATLSRLRAYRRQSAPSGAGLSRPHPPRLPASQLVNEQLGLPWDCHGPHGGQWPPDGPRTRQLPANRDIHAPVRDQMGRRVATPVADCRVATPGAGRPGRHHAGRRLPAGRWPGRQTKASAQAPPEIAWTRPRREPW